MPRVALYLSRLGVEALALFWLLTLRLMVLMRLWGY